MTVKVGDVILVTKTFLDCGMYSVGDILEVEEIHSGFIRAKGMEFAIGIDEFEVIQNGIPQHLCETAVGRNSQRAS